MSHELGYMKRLLIVVLTSAILLVILRPGIAYLSVWRGEQFALQRDRESAIVQFQRAVFLDPTYSYAHASLGYLLDKTGRPEAAIDAFRAAVENGAGELDRLVFANLLLQNDQPKEAVEVLEALVEDDGSLSGQWLLLAMAYEADGRIDDAIETWGLVAERFPDAAGGKVDPAAEIERLEDQYDG